MTAMNNKDNLIAALRILTDAYNRQVERTHYTDDFKILIECGTLRVRVFRVHLKRKVERTWGLERITPADAEEAVQAMLEKGLIREK